MPIGSGNTTPSTGSKNTLCPGPTIAKRRAQARCLDHPSHRACSFLSRWMATVKHSKVTVGATSSQHVSTHGYSNNLHNNDSRNMDTTQSLGCNTHHGLPQLRTATFSSHPGLSFFCLWFSRFSFRLIFFILFPFLHQFYFYLVVFTTHCARHAFFAVHEANGAYHMMLPGLVL